MWRAEPLSLLQGLQHFRELFSDGEQKKVDSLKKKLQAFDKAATRTFAAAGRDAAAQADAFTSVKEEQMKMLKAMEKL